MSGQSRKGMTHFYCFPPESTASMSPYLWHFQFNTICCELNCIPPPKKNIHPVSVNVTLFGNKVFADVIELTWGHTGLRSSVTDASIEKKKRDRETTTTWRWGRSRRCAATSQRTPGLPGAGTDKEGSSPEPLEGAWLTSPPLDPGLQNSKRVNFFSFKQP